MVVGKMRVIYRNGTFASCRVNRFGERIDAHETTQELLHVLVRAFEAGLKVHHLGVGVDHLAGHAQTEERVRALVVAAVAIQLALRRDVLAAGRAVNVTGEQGGGDDDDERAHGDDAMRLDHSIVLIDYNSTKLRCSILFILTFQIFIFLNSCHIYSRVHTQIPSYSLAQSLETRITPVIVAAYANANVQATFGCVDGCI